MEIVLKNLQTPLPLFPLPLFFSFFPLSCSFVGLFLHLDPCLVFRVRMWGGRDLGFPEGIGVVLCGLRDTEVIVTSLEPYISISPSDASAWSLFVPLAKHLL